MFSRSSSQDAKSRATAGKARIQSRAYQAKAGAVRAQGRARQATTQVAPLAKSAQETAGRGLLEARAWAAPRVEATGVAVQERLAPAVSSLAVHGGRGRGAGCGLRCRRPDTAQQAGRDGRGGPGPGNGAAHAADHAGGPPGDDRRSCGRERAGQDALTGA